MGCTYFAGPGFIGHSSHGDHFVSLEPYGANVWCDHHDHLGPTFYRSAAAIWMANNMPPERLAAVRRALEWKGSAVDEYLPPNRQLG